MLSSIYKQKNEYLIIHSPNILEVQIWGGKKNQRKTEEKHRQPRHIPKPGHRLCCLLSWLYEILSSVKYILVLLPTGDVSSYWFPSGSGGFFFFLNSFQGPLWGSFQFPLRDDSSAFGWLPSVNSHISEPVLPLFNSLTISLQLCTSLPCWSYLDLGSGTCTSEVLGHEILPLHTWVLQWLQWHLHCLFFGNGFAHKGKPPSDDLKYHALECGGNLLLWHFEKHGQCLISFVSLCHWQTGN